MTNPRILLLDEVFFGLSPLPVDLVYKSLEGLIRLGATIVLVEQDLKRARRFATRVICMLEVRIVLEDHSADVTTSKLLKPVSVHSETISRKHDNGYDLCQLCSPRHAAGRLLCANRRRSFFHARGDEDHQRRAWHAGATGRIRVIPTRSAIGHQSVRRALDRVAVRCGGRMARSA